MSLKPVLGRIADGGVLDAAEAEAAFATLLAGEAGDAEIGALLMGLRVRGEAVSEIRGAVAALRSRMVTIAAPPGAIDLCGTGGDGQATLNVSTAAAFVVAACGVPVAKHGNRAVSSRSGGADVLLALGIDPDPPVETQARLLAELGLAFLFAPRHHAAMRHAAAARRAIGIRSILNIAGPLSNPAGARRQLTGVFDARFLQPMAEALRDLGTERAWLVHGAGLDEMTLAGETDAVSLEADGTIRAFTVTPEEAGLPRAPHSAIAGGDPRANAAALGDMLDGRRGAYRDTVVLNAAAALVIAGRAPHLREGAREAEDAIATGAAARLLGAMRAAVPASAVSASAEMV